MWTRALRATDGKPSLKEKAVFTVPARPAEDGLTCVCRGGGSFKARPVERTEGGSARPRHAVRTNYGFALRRVSKPPSPLDAEWASRPPFLANICPAREWPRLCLPQPNTLRGELFEMP